ncbi:Mitochondrial GTPase, partial [Serendipita sp. 399]
PPYPSLFSEATEKRPKFPPTDSIDVFLAELAQRMGYLRSGGVPDLQRAAKWFVEWWRVSGAKRDGLGGTASWGWGLDCQWEDYWSLVDSSTPQRADGHGAVQEIDAGENGNVGDRNHMDQQESVDENEGAPSSDLVGDESDLPLVSPSGSLPPIEDLESKFDRVIRRYLEQTKELGIEVSKTQLKKRALEEVKQQVEKKKNAVYGQKKRSYNQRSR